jgi:DNA-binding CsgD family transcriptional regulator
MKLPCQRKCDSGIRGPVDAKRGNLALADVEALLKCVGAIYAHGNEDTFRRRLVAAVAELVPSESVHLTEIDTAAGLARTMCNVHDPDAIKNLPILAEHAHTHPRVLDFFATGDGRAMTISDFLSRADWEERAVFKEFYVPSGYPDNDQMCVMLPTKRPRDVCVAIALNRVWGSTTERDRLVLNLIRPHIIQGFANAAAVQRLEDLNRGIESALAASGLAAVELDANHRIIWSTPAAQTLFERYFPRDSATLLPADVRRWITRSCRAVQQSLSPIAPYVAKLPGKQLSIRCIRREEGESLILEERAAAVSTPQLSPRLEQVLAQLRGGGSEKEIAARLGLSRSTIHEYVKAIYRTFGVNSRAELMARIASGG